MKYFGGRRGELLQEGRADRLKRNAAKSALASPSKNSLLFWAYGSWGEFSLRLWGTAGLRLRFSMEGKPITTNKSPDRISGICFPAIEEKGIKSISIKTAHGNGALSAILKCP